MWLLSVVNFQWTVSFECYDSLALDPRSVRECNFSNSSGVWEGGKPFLCVSFLHWTAVINLNNKQVHPLVDHCRVSEFIFYIC